MPLFGLAMLLIAMSGTPHDPTPRERFFTTDSEPIIRCGIHCGYKR